MDVATTDTLIGEITMTSIFVTTDLLPINVSSTDSHNTTEITDALANALPELPYWLIIFDYTQLGFTVIGFFANFFTLLTLTFYRKGFNRLVVILLRHQSFMDSLVCLMASVVVVQPYMWMTGVTWLDQFICHAWHGQAFYWGAVTLSTYNLVCLAVERYIAVGKPLSYPHIVDMSKAKMAAIFLTLYIGTLIITHGTFLQTRLEDKVCIGEYFMDGDAVEKYFFSFVIFTYITTYCIPALIMAILYGIVAYKLHRRSKDQSLGHSSVIEKATTQLTKTAVVVTVIFIVTIGYDLHYYLLGYTGVTHYNLNSPVQKFGVFLSNLNSCVNPFIYALLMPQYRHNISMMCRRCICAPTMEPESSSITTRSVSVVALSFIK